MSDLTTAAVFAASQAASEGGGSGLGFLLLAGLLLFLVNRGGKQIRWEYTGRDGKQHTTDWYDADKYYWWEDPRDRTHFEVRRKDGAS